MARRLVEAGVSAVEISLGGWDTHNGNFNALATRQLPTLDRAMGSLVEDLVQRALHHGSRSDRFRLRMGRAVPGLLSIANLFA